MHLKDYIGASLGMIPPMIILPLNQLRSRPLHNPCGPVLSTTPSPTVPERHEMPPKRCVERRHAAKPCNGDGMCHAELHIFIKQKNAREIPGCPSVQHVPMCRRWEPVLAAPSPAACACRQPHILPDWECQNMGGGAACWQQIRDCSRDALNNSTAQSVACNLDSVVSVPRGFRGRQDHQNASLMDK
eukprot:s451_g5.t1